MAHRSQVKLKSQLPYNQYFEEYDVKNLYVSPKNTIQDRNSDKYIKLITEKLVQHIKDL